MRTARATVAAMAAATILVTGLAALGSATALASDEPGDGLGRNPGRKPVRPGWELVHAENFSNVSRVGDTGWFPDKDGPGSPYNVGPYDNDGAFFDAIGGPAFAEQLSTIDLYRRSFAFGDNGWLTAELAARDTDGDGVSDEAPSFSRDVIPAGGPTGLIKEPSHHGGVIIRSTRGLPEEYRIEMTLKTLDFGGQRHGDWDYGGEINGYTPDGCNTNFPWAAGGDFSRDECEWFDVARNSNGFYYLSIMDYARPAPHNNVFIHTHRKVSMDSYNRYKYTGDGLLYCNPNTGRYEPYQWGSGNGVNMIFETDDRRYGGQPGNEYIMPSECGTKIGGAIVSQVDLMPELLPQETYRFAIERHDGAYVLEVSGKFRHVGKRTFRYKREFVQDGHPIWHYNQRPDTYDGRYNTDWTYTSPNGKYVDENVWPAGSAYPDYFLIGEPHMNFYEGNARIDNIRLYTPQK